MDSNTKNQDYTNTFFDEVNKINYKKCSSFLFCLNPFEFSSLGYLVGLLIAAALNANEQDSIGNWLQLVGQTIQTISAQEALFQPPDVSQSDFDSFKKDIMNQLDSILKKK